MQDAGEDLHQHHHPLVLQTFTATPAATLWDQVFPAATWRRVVGERELTATVEGERMQLMGAKDGRRERLGPVREGRRRVPLAALDHDWFWFEGEVRSVSWSVEAQVELPPVTAIVPTFRREADAIAQARRFARMGPVGEVVVIDQGGTLATHPGFTQLLAEMDTIRLVSQPNLGGSGGYARGMLEAERTPGSAVLFSDDDAIIGEESLRRMLTYQALASRPTIVGCALFSSEAPRTLIAHAEVVEPRSFQWAAAGRMRAAVDLTGTSPEQWTFLSAPGKANYTGWWGTLFPPGTSRDLGLPLPFFLKWDDAEYGLRATARGYEHAVLPGTSVHHPPWNAFRTQMSWSARVLHRNRLATAAAYGASRGVIASSLLHQCKHILAGQHLTTELWEQGIDAFRAGPEAWLGTDLDRAREDGQRVITAWEAAQAEQSPAAGDLEPSRSAPLPMTRALPRALVRFLQPDRPPRVVVAVSAQELRWRSILGADAVIVTEADGTRITTITVRASTARHLLARTVRSHAGLALRWPFLRRRYRRALPPHMTPDAWEQLFAAHRRTTPPNRNP